MLSGLTLGIVFFCGMLFQGLIILRKNFFAKLNLLILPSTLGFVLLIFMQKNINVVGNWGLFLLLWAGIWVLPIAIINKWRVMMRINEAVLLQLLIVAVYVIAQSELSNFMRIVLFTSVLLPSPLIIYLGFSSRAVSKSLKLSLFIWFLAVSVITAAVSINTIPFGLILKDSSAVAKDVVANMVTTTALSNIGEVAFVFLTAMFAFGIIANVAYLVELFPHTKWKSWEEEKIRVGEAINDLLQKYDDTNLLVRDALAIMVIQGGFLLINHLLGAIPPYFAVSISLVATQLIVFRELNLASLVASSIFAALGLGAKKSK